jgi:hypothetical protein
LRFVVLFTVLHVLPLSVVRWRVPSAPLATAVRSSRTAMLKTAVFAAVFDGLKEPSTSAR